MPVYAYECKECGVRFERRQSFNDDPITVCPECEGQVRRLIQPAGIVFKGSGFYVTDNRSSSKSTVSNSSTSESSSKSASAEKKTESDSASSKAKKKKD